MKLVKKWLFPILTCLTVMGAAVLPPYISQVKDGRQFAQIHILELDADALPVWEGRNLLERLELYARWSTDHSEVIPSFQTMPFSEETADMELAVQVLNQALNRLTQADVIPAHLLELPLEPASIYRVLLWDPADSIGGQEPVEFWEMSADWGKGSLVMIVDGESGLPLRLSLFDPNMARWLQYKDPDTLPNMAERYFDLLELVAEPVETGLPPDAAPWERDFVIEGTEIRYSFSFNATLLSIHLERINTRTYIGFDIRPCLKNDNA